MAHTKTLQTALSGYQVQLEQINTQNYQQLRLWRNLDDVRLMMRNTDRISEAQHQQWFNGLTDRQQHFIVYYKHEAIGAINITARDTESLLTCQHAEVGLYIVHPVYKGNIIAFSPSLVINDYAFNDLGIRNLRSEVKSSNSAALKYNQQLGYDLGKSKQGFTDICLSADSFNEQTLKLKSFLSR